MLAARSAPATSMTEKNQDQHGLSISAPVRRHRRRHRRGDQRVDPGLRHDAAAVRRDLLPLLLAGLPRRAV
jgi:hypothetical protein